MSLNLGDINEAIAAAIPDSPAIVSPGRSFTWRDFQNRTRRLANVLLEADLGCRREPAALAPWESGQDHVALYLYNGPEYLEAMIGAYKARAIPFNVNYRYAEEDLAYLLGDAETRAIVYHASFAPLLKQVLARIPKLALLLRVADGSAESPIEGSRDYEEALAGASAVLPGLPRSGGDRYLVYTGGTTGRPKGVLWRQEDIFIAAMGGNTLVQGDSLEPLVEGAKRSAGLFRMLSTPPFMHASGQWSVLGTLHRGGTIVVQNNVRSLDPDDVWSTIERERVTSLTIVGDAFARPLIDQLKRRRYDTSSLLLIGSGGAALSPSSKQALLEAIPQIAIFEGYGASETGAQGATLSSAAEGIRAAELAIDEENCVLDERLGGRLEAGAPGHGWLARRGHIPLGYFRDPAKTKRTFPVVGGVRYVVSGDRARILDDGRIVPLGRDSLCINTGGEKVFVEEVEEALKQHPAVEDALVVGLPHERWGEQVTALVKTRAGERVEAAALRDAIARSLARYKVPKEIFFVAAVPRSPTGKADYPQAKETARNLFAAASRPR